MEKILIGLIVPAVSLHLDLFVPPESTFEQLTALIARGVAELSSGRYCVSGMEVLTLRDPDLLPDPHLTLADYGIQDGAQLVLL